MSFVSQHKKIAEGWHLTTKELKDLGYPALNAFQTRRLTGCDTPSYEMQYDDLSGKPNGISRYRLFDPTKVPPGPDSKPRKYTCPAKSPVSLFLPRGLRRAWARYAKDTKRTLYITEGEAKALYAVVRQGLPCIAVQGNSGWQAGGVPAAQFEWFDWTDRRVVIIPDSDFRRNPDIRQWFAKLGKYLEGRGANVKFRLLPDLSENFNYDTPTKYKTGLDDWFFHTGNGVEEFRKLPTYPITHEYIQSWDSTPASVVETLIFEPRPLNVLTETPPEREYVAATWIGKGQQVFLAMAGGAGKGFLTLGLAVHVATGRQWFGMPVLQGRVALLCLEDSLEELDRRLHYVVAQYVAWYGLRGKIKRDLYAQVLENVRYESVEGRQLYVIEERQHNIVRTPALLALTEKLKSVAPILTIVDPLSQLHSLNENDNSVGSALVAALGYIRTEVGTAILVPAHVSKAADERGTKTANAMRGASSFATGARSVIHGDVLSPEEAAKTFQIEARDATDKFAVFTHVKNNYGPKADPLYLVRGAEGVWQRHDPTVIPFKTKADTAEQWVALLQRWLSKQKRAWFNKTEVTQDRVQEIFNCGRPDAVKQWDAAVAAGALRTVTKEERKQIPSAARRGPGKFFCLAEASME